MLGFVLRLRREGIIERERDNSFFLRFLFSGEVLSSKEVSRFMGPEGLSLAKRIQVVCGGVTETQGRELGCSTGR